MPTDSHPSRYSFEDDDDDHHHHHHHHHNHNNHNNNNYYSHAYGFPTASHSLPASQGPPRPPSPSRYLPTAHPDGVFHHSRAPREDSQERRHFIDSPLQNDGEPLSLSQSQSLSQSHSQSHSQSSYHPPAVPQHRDTWTRVPRNNPSTRRPTTSTYSNITPGADNFGELAAGGMTGIAINVADAHGRESGIDAVGSTGYDPTQPSYEERPSPRQDSQGSLTPLGAAAFPPGLSTPKARSLLSRSGQSTGGRDAYLENPYVYNRHSQLLDTELIDFDPASIVDDGDDGLDYRNAHRNSMLSLGKQSDSSGGNSAPGLMGTIGGMVGGKKAYDSVHTSADYTAPNTYPLTNREKDDWATKPPGGNKKRRLWISLAAGFILLAAIIGGSIGGTLYHGPPSKQTSSSANTDTQTNGDLNVNSNEIVSLLNNDGLHKVFPGIDYTPMYTQYPDCISYPPSQNNITRDLAVLSQLTNTIRLYGTDCNQTEMLLHSIDQLKLKGTVKVWLGVWQDTNATTNARQLEQLYDILDKYDASSFKGVIVGNEVLYRKDMTATELNTVITDVRSNLTSRSIDLPVASSDLGDDWTSELAANVDFVMANIHPFFAGVTAEVAAGWTWDFWQSHDVTYKTNASQNIISETGWPSQGGTDCGGATTCTEGSVANITGMNTFMDDWVCQALANGTTYFWFEAFDEPWKIKYNSGDENWEDHWGLLDVNRKLKSGIKIPDCDGKTVD